MEKIMDLNSSKTGPTMKSSYKEEEGKLSGKRRKDSFEKRKPSISLRLALSYLPISLQNRYPKLVGFRSSIEKFEKSLDIGFLLGKKHLSKFTAEKSQEKALNITIEKNLFMSDAFLQNSHLAGNDILSETPANKPI